MGVFCFLICAKKAYLLNFVMLCFSFDQYFVDLFLFSLNLCRESFVL